jgi:hypothetical protein
VTLDATKGGKFSPKSVYPTDLSRRPGVRYESVLGGTLGPRYYKPSIPCRLGRSEQAQLHLLVVLRPLFDAGHRLLGDSGLIPLWVLPEGGKIM